jgi:hypothetical protein
MNVTRITEVDEFSRTYMLLIRGLHDLAARLPRYQEVADSLSSATALCVIEELKLEFRHLHRDELACYTERVICLATALNQAIAEWQAERD